MYYPEELVEEIRMKNDIVDVISGYVKLKRAGSSYKGLCPFHNEKTASFSVSQSKQMYHCFGCGAGGNVISFVMEYENYSFLEALKFLAERAGIPLPEEEMTDEMKKNQSLRSKIFEINKMAAKYFYYQLRTENGSHAMKYLKDRQLTDETMRRFGLGYANKYSNDLYQYLKKQGIEDTLLRESGLMNVDEKNGMYDKFWNRVIFPIMDVNGRVIGFGGRVMGDGKPKYLNSPETKIFDKSRNLYGLNLARSARKKYLLLCEGYMDVISLHQAGFTNAVASLGTALTSSQCSLIKRYANEVILTYDSDTAGVRAALRAIPLLREAGVAAKVLSMEPYKDPDEFIKALGAEEFQKRIDQAQNSFLFETDILQREYDMKDPQGKTAFHEELARKLVEFDTELERENYIEAVAQRYQIGFENLRKLVNRTAMKQVSVPGTVTRPRKQHTDKDDGVIKSQKLLLTWLIEYPNLYKSIKNYIKKEDFTQGLYQTVAELLFAQYEQGERNPARIISHFTEPEEQREAAALFNATLQVDSDTDRQKALKEMLSKIISNSLNIRTANLDPTDLAGFQNLIQDRKKLAQIQTLQIEF